MDLPDPLTPTATERFALSDGHAVEVPKATPAFRLWPGPPPGDTYGGKPVLDANGHPAFAELAILDLLRKAGWDGVWIDTYRNKHRTGYWGVPPVDALPSGPAELLRRILDARGAGRSGTWDVYCWRGADVLFVEAKRAGRDSIRPSQVTWLEAALQVGIPAGSFLVAEWSVV
jgi:hypothetical protein